MGWTQTSTSVVHSWQVVKDEEKADPQDPLSLRPRQPHVERIASSRGFGRAAERFFFAFTESLRLGDGDPETLAPEPAIFSSTSELQVPPALIGLFWKKRETVVPRRPS